VGALRVHPHKHCANYPPQKDRGSNERSRHRREELPEAEGACHGRRREGQRRTVTDGRRRTCLWCAAGFTLLDQAVSRSAVVSSFFRVSAKKAENGHNASTSFGATSATARGSRPTTATKANAEASAPALNQTSHVTRSARTSVRGCRVPRWVSWRGDAATVPARRAPGRDRRSRRQLAGAGSSVL